MPTLRAQLAGPVETFARMGIIKLRGQLPEPLSSLPALPPNQLSGHVLNCVSPSTPKFVSGLRRTKRKQRILIDAAKGKEKYF